MRHITFKQWLKHVRQWIWQVKNFPLPTQPDESLHIYTGVMNSGHVYCFTCGREKYESDRVDYRCIRCVEEVKFISPDTWECTECDAHGDIRDLVGDSERDLKRVQEVAKHSLVV